MEISRFENERRPPRHSRKPRLIQIYDNSLCDIEFNSDPWSGMELQGNIRRPLSLSLSLSLLFSFFYFFFLFSFFYFWIERSIKAAIRSVVFAIKMQKTRKIKDEMIHDRSVLTQTTFCEIRFALILDFHSR